MTPDYILGYHLASAPNPVLQAALADRPFTLAQLRRLNELLPHPTRPSAPDAFLNPSSKPDPNPNEVQLATIVAPPGIVRRHRRVTRVRLRYMQEELSHPCDSIPEPVTSEIEVEEENECAA